MARCGPQAARWNALHGSLRSAPRAGAARHRCEGDRPGMSARLRQLITRRDVSRADFIRHLPAHLRALPAVRIDITKEPIPVVPAAHYMCGGVMTDIDGRHRGRAPLRRRRGRDDGMHGANRWPPTTFEGAGLRHRAAVHAQSCWPAKPPRRPLFPSGAPPCRRHRRIGLSTTTGTNPPVAVNYVGIMRSDRRSSAPRHASPCCARNSRVLLGLQVTG